MKPMNQLLRVMLVTWATVIAAVFAFLTTMLAAMGMRGYAPMLTYGVAVAAFLGILLAAMAIHAAMQRKQRARAKIRALAGYVAALTLVLLVLPFVAPEIAPRALVVPTSALFLCGLGFFVVGYAEVQQHQDTRGDA